MDFRELARLQEENRRNPSEGPWPSAERDPFLSRAIAQHLRPYCGDWQGVVHEKRSWLVHLEVFLFGPTPEHPYVDFHTTGMSQRAMNDTHARHSGLPERAELLLRLPASWAGGESVLHRLDDEVMRWPMLLLNALARLPHERRSCLRHEAVVELGRDAYSGFPFEGVITVIAAWCGVHIPPLIRPDGAGVDFLRVIPLHGSEIDFAKEHGPTALLDFLEDAGVNEIVDLERGCVV